MTVKLIRASGRAMGRCEVWVMWKCHLEATAVIMKLIKNRELHPADGHFLFLPVFPAPRVRGSRKGRGGGPMGTRSGPSPHFRPGMLLLGGPGDPSPSPLLLGHLCGLTPSLSSEETVVPASHSSAELTPGGRWENEHF